MASSRSPPPRMVGLLRGKCKRPRRADSSPVARSATESGPTRLRIDEGVPTRLAQFSMPRAASRQLLGPSFFFPGLLLEQCPVPLAARALPQVRARSLRANMGHLPPCSTRYAPDPSCHIGRCAPSRPNSQRTAQNCRCPRFARVLWALTWDHCTHHRDCYKFAPGPRASSDALACSLAAE